MREAFYQKRIIGAEEGVDIRDQLGIRPEFQCVECRSPARVHRAGGNAKPHFEHLERNEHCSLVHRHP